jgi:hypothetical protein
METTSRSSGCTVGGASGSSHYRMPLEADGPENDLADTAGYHEMMSDVTEWCLDSLIAETSARWKQQLHDSLRSSSSSHLCARLQADVSLSSSLALSDAAPTLSESPQRMVHPDRESGESTEQELLQRRILSQQRREIQSLRAQLVAASKVSAPNDTGTSVPPHIVLLTAHGATDYDDLIADDDLTLDL